MAYDDTMVEAAVRSVKQRGLARFVHPSHGRSVLRYEHQLGEVLGIDRAQLALLAVLMLRGPQTLGELRSRTDRMVEFDDLAQVAHDLDLLAEAAVPLVVRLPRRPGQKEDRVAHLLGAGGAEERAGALHAGGGDAADGAGGQSWAPSGSVRSPAVLSTTADGGTEPDWRSALEALRQELAAVRRDLDEVRRELGMDDTADA